MGRRTARVARILVCLAAWPAGSGPVAEATAAARPPSRAVMLVAMRPGEDAVALVAAIGGEIGGRVGPVLLVRGRSPDLALRLWKAGALAVTGDPRIVQPIAALARQATARR